AVPDVKRRGPVGTRRRQRHPVQVDAALEEPAADQGVIGPGLLLGRQAFVDNGEPHERLLPGENRCAHYTPGRRDSRGQAVAEPSAHSASGSLWAGASGARCRYSAVLSLKSYLPTPCQAPQGGRPCASAC